MTIHIESDRMTADEAGHTAERVDTDVWRVSWLDGQWTRNQANTALLIADIVAHRPPMNHKVWRCVENFLTELGLDPACLDDLIDPEPDDDTDVEDAS